MTFLEELVRGSAAPPLTTPRVTDYLDALDTAHREHGAHDEGTVARAVRAGLLADRLGFAFAGGYEAALLRMVGVAIGAERARRACLCATEPGGAHPKNIATRLSKDGDAFVLQGKKTFATLALEAETLIVVASRGVEEGRNRLVLVAIPAAREGITRVAKPETPFAPEIVHAEVTFDRVRVAADEVLEGDGYDRYLKPFRTIEDVHVMSAMLGYVVAVARRSRWGAEAEERLFALIVAMLPLGAADPTSGATHRALGGVLAEVERTLSALDPSWASCDPAERARWERDRPLLLVASTARAQRLVTARKATSTP